MAAMTLEAMEKEIEALRSQVESLGGTPVNLNKAAVVRKKGVAICSEQVDDDAFEAPVFPKGPGTRVLIEGAMSA